MGRQRKKSPDERKGGSLRRMLNEIEISQLTDIEFRALVIRKLNELTKNYH